MTRSRVRSVGRASRLDRARRSGLRATFRKAWNRLLFGPAFSLFERVGIHVLPVHYYSPVPDTRRLRSDRAWAAEQPFEGIDFDADEQKQLLTRLAPYGEESAGLLDYRDVERMALGEGYGEVEAHVLFAMLRHMRPRRLVEIGGGTSTWYACAALERNRNDGVACSHRIIEPYPRPALRGLAREHAIGLDTTPLEGIPLDVFRGLGRGDVLFIDSSHVVRLGGDVPYLYLNVLPAVRPGVLIHIHDIPFPFHVPDPEYWIFRRHMFWTEPMLLHAFLAFNRAFRIRLCLSWLAHRQPRALAAAFPVMDGERHHPTSIWIERVADVRGGQSAPMSRPAPVDPAVPEVWSDVSPSGVGSDRSSGGRS